jgi:hypothetical protein
MQSNQTYSKTVKTKPSKSDLNGLKQAYKGKTWKRDNTKRNTEFN